MEELLDIYTKDGKYVGIMSREECHKKDCIYYHKPAWTWVYNDKKEILVQKRASCKKTLPNYWDMPCAGHVDAGEDTIDGVIREAKEEIGLILNKEDCKFMFEYLEEDCHEIGQVYFVKSNKAIEEFKLQIEEVSEIKWLNFDEFKKLLYSDKWVPYDKEYKDKVVAEFEKIFDI